MNSFDKNNFHSLCDILAEKDNDLKNIIAQYSYPPLWSRVPSFATLIHIILEQQVSLASAKAAFLKLESKIGHIIPEKILQLSDEEMKACYFSRQKMKYSRHLAETILKEELNIDALQTLPDDLIRTALKKVKGIGDWTVDVYLMMVLHRNDCFATGDIALIKSIKEVKGLPPLTSKEEILSITENWKPYRTVAAFMLWHAYIKKRNLKF
jgi:DNA-3-methyladenine glycosylase II